MAVNKNYDGYICGSAQPLGRWTVSGNWLINNSYTIGPDPISSYTFPDPDDPSKTITVNSVRELKEALELYHKYQKYKDK